MMARPSVYSFILKSGQISFLQKDTYIKPFARDCIELHKPVEQQLTGTLASCTQEKQQLTGQIDLKFAPSGQHSH